MMYTHLTKHYLRDRGVREFGYEGPEPLAVRYPLAMRCAFVRYERARVWWRAKEWLARAEAKVRPGVYLRYEEAGPITPQMWDAMTVTDPFRLRET